MSATRTALITAAQQSFATRGFAGTSIRDLAAAAGIKESSVYNHFPSKQSILDEVLTRAGEHLAELGLVAGLGDPTAAAATLADIGTDELATIARRYLEAWTSAPDVVAARRILTLEQFRTPAAGQRLRDLLVDSPLVFQTAIFAELVDRGLFSDEPADLALAFWGPIVAILMTVDEPRAKRRNRDRLDRHLAHFTRTYAR